MKLKVGKYYITRNFQTIKIEGKFQSGAVEVFYDRAGRFYFIDGVPTSGSVGDEFRIVGEL